jgi:magnesium transporter
VWDLVRSRIVWLLVLIVAATLTVNVLDYFEATLAEVVTLALFIPLLIGTGGNVGAQAATTVVRALAVADVRFRDLPRVVIREVFTGFMLGAILAAIAYIPAALLVSQDIALVLSIALVVVCTLATLIGSMIPLFAQRFGVDPAVVSAPFITTIVDATGLIVYFLVARAVLGL